MYKPPFKLGIVPGLSLYMPQNDQHAEAIYEAIIETLHALQQRFIWANPAPTLADIQQQVTSWQETYAKEQPEEWDRYSWMILKHGFPDVEMMGIISLTRIENNGFEFGYWIRDSAQGKGIVSKAITAILEQVTARYFRIRCAADNEASKAIAKKFGFKYRYTQKDALKWPDGRTKDMCAFILET